MIQARPPQERFGAFYEVAENGCHIWTGQTTRAGYPQFWNGKTMLAHRYAYEQVHGPIPAGMHVHHECETPACVNPAHLRAVTPRENLMASDTPAARNAAKTACPRGHVYDYVYPDGRRSCRRCASDRMRRWRAAR